MVVFAFTAHDTRVSYEAFLLLEEEVNADAASWAIGKPFVILGKTWLPSLIATEEKLEIALQSVAHAFTLHTVYLALVLFLFLPVGFFYGRMLKAQIKLITRAQGGAHSSNASSRDFRSMKQAYRLLIIEASIIATLAMLYIGLCLWVVIDRHSALTNPHNLSFIYTISFLCALVSESLLCIMILHRTLQPILKRRKRRSTGQEISEGVHISTSIHVEVDNEGDNAEPLQYLLASYTVNDSKALALQYANQLGREQAAITLERLDDKF